MKFFMKKNKIIFMFVVVLTVASLLTEAVFCANEPVDAGGVHCSAEICSCVCHNPGIKQESNVSITYQPIEGCTIVSSSQIKGSQCNQEIFVPPRV